ncbi:hypothetical protein [Nonomuraea rosea]|uniref:hypothetical protein n=1 Tax=Nonomuraea rosea TaxID=638574 RepID=UPI0031E6BBCD
MSRSPSPRRIGITTTPSSSLVRSLGGEVRVLEYLPDRSATAIIGRMRSLP